MGNFRKAVVLKEWKITAKKKGLFGKYEVLSIKSETETGAKSLVPDGYKVVCVREVAR